MPNCKNCYDRFPSTVVIDGKSRNLGGRSFCLKCSPFGKHNTSKAPTRATGCGEEKYCSGCEKTFPVSDFYASKKDGELYHYCKSCTNFRSRAHQKGFKQLCVDYLGSGCIQCGYNKCLSALEFHHKDPGSKDFIISQVRRFDETTKKELDKCDLVCANCHREIHEDLLKEHYDGATET